MRGCVHCHPPRPGRGRLRPARRCRNRGPTLTRRVLSARLGPAVLLALGRAIPTSWVPTPETSHPPGSSFPDAGTRVPPRPWNSASAKMPSAPCVDVGPPAHRPRARGDGGGEGRAEPEPLSAASSRLPRPAAEPRSGARVSAPSGRVVGQEAASTRDRLGPQRPPLRASLLRIVRDPSASTQSGRVRRHGPCVPLWLGPGAFASGSPTDSHRAGGAPSRRNAMMATWRKHGEPDTRAGAEA